MPAPAPVRRVVRLERFEIDLRAGELRKDGRKVRLQEQPFRVLEMLLERPGEVVTREELRQKLWPADTFVDFDVGLNTAIMKLREALGDSAEKPRYIETLPKRGYRLIKTVEAQPDAVLPAAGETGAVATHRFRRRWIIASALTLVLLLAAALALWNRRSAPGVSTAPIRSIAVLPFDNLTGIAEQDWLADSVTDVLTSEIAQVKALSVRPRYAVINFKKDSPSMKEIARALDVGAIVEGSITRTGEKLSINVQLIDASSNAHLFARIYDREFAELHLLQAQIARDIVAALRLDLTEEDRARLGRARTASPDVIEAYLRGRAEANRITEPGLLRSIQLFRTAIAKEPNYAPAYAGLARSYMFLRQLYQPEDMIPQARAAAIQAMALDPLLHEPHTWLAQISEDDGDLAAAEAEHRRALELNIGEPWPHLFYGQFLSRNGRDEEALRELRRAEELDPYSPFVSANLISRLKAMARLEDAERQFQKTIRLDPDFWLAYHFMGEVYAKQGETYKAIAHWEKAATLPGHYHWPLGQLIRAYMKIGRREDALRVLEEWEADARRRKPDPPVLPRMYVIVGKHDEAIQMLSERMPRGIVSRKELEHPEYEPVRGDARFQRLLRQASLNRSSELRRRVDN